MNAGWGELRPGVGSWGGRAKAEAPPTAVGNVLMRDAHGHNVLNPLAVIYGCFNTI